MKHKTGQRQVGFGILLALAVAALNTLGFFQSGRVAGASEAPSFYDTCPNVSCPFIVPEFVLLLPHPESCSSYCICDWGVPISMKCPHDLHFNPTLMVCDWPANAGCTVETGGGQ